MFHFELQLIYYREDAFNIYEIKDDTLSLRAWSENQTEVKK